MGIRTVKTNIPTAKSTVINTAETMTKSSKKTAQRTPAPTKRALAMVGRTSNTDVNGSYTGVPKNKKEQPVQDADDL